MHLSSIGSFLPATALAVPVTFLIGALLSPRRAVIVSRCALVFALAFGIASALSHGPLSVVCARVGVRGDAATGVMLGLVVGLGVIIVGFSRTYLDGERELDRYFRWLLLTLGAVAMLVVADNLLVIALCWTATSLALHQLLTFYSDRSAARIAAHKKFIVSRLADVCLAAALWIVYANVGELGLDAISDWVSARPSLPPSMHWGAVLLAAAVVLRSAQLPFHGWITQVMEAPTPVSALLHAGVVNIGGFVLLRVAGWISRVQAAQLLLVVTGALTCTVAALVMTTRVSIKLHLAWSTCAQMGFMLVQCGLGLWPLALLHLVAHSLYKAHAFLTAGSAVDDWKIAAFGPIRATSTAMRMAAITILSVLGAMACGDLWRRASGASSSASDLFAEVLLGAALVPLFLRASWTSLRSAAESLLAVVVVVSLYLLWHGLAVRLSPVPTMGTAVIGWWVAAVAFATLLALKLALQARPTGRFARALHPWLFAGLYADDLFTSVAFRAWPPPAASPVLRDAPVSASAHVVEVRV